MKNALKRFPGVLTFVFTFVLLSACSMRGVLFNFAETLAVVRLDQMFDLTSEQKNQASLKIEEFFRWFKGEKRNELVRILTGLKSDWADGLSQDEYSRFRASLRAILLDAGMKLGNLFTPMAGSLSEKQLDHFAEFLEESNEDRQKLVDSKDYSTNRREELKENSERWYGEITDAQLDEIANFSRGKEGLMRYLEQRRASQKYVVDYMRAHRSDPSKMNELLRLLFEDPGRLRPSSMREEYEKMRSEWSMVWVKTDALMTSDQRLRALSYLDSWIEDFKEF